ncbi:MAG: hypothetical protein LQ352_007460 [Teloschistes flavicans]|nr:MAG: hypothetical protein LQ352_007460 [Teloschistes flavicans]
MAEDSSSAEVNGKTSLLLQELPLEVRNLIYSFVFGSQMMHLYRTPSIPGPGTLTHIVCRSHYPEVTAYEQSIQRPSSSCPQGYWQRHDQCMPSNTTRFNGPHPLLLVSRQITAEAKPEFWKHTIFSVTESRALVLFIAKLDHQQKDQVTHLNFCSEQDGDHEMTWSGRRHNRPLHSLRGLKSIQLSLNLEQCARQAQPLARARHDYPNFFLAPFLTVQRLPLEHIRVIVTDFQDTGSADYPVNLFTDPQCPLSSMATAPGQAFTFNWLQKRAFACDFEVRLLHGSDPSFDIQAEVTRKLALDVQARAVLPAFPGQHHDDEDEDKDGDDENAWMMDDGEDEDNDDDDDDGEDENGEDENGNDNDNEDHDANTAQHVTTTSTTSPVTDTASPLAAPSS